MLTAAPPPLENPSMAHPNGPMGVEGLESAVLTAREHLQVVQDKHRRRVKGGTQKAVDAAVSALAAAEALYEDAGLGAQAPTPGKRSTPSPSPSARGAAPAKRIRGTLAPGVAMEGGKGASSDEAEESDSAMGHSKRGPGPPHAIIIPELEKQASGMALWRLRGLHAIAKYRADLSRPEPKGVRIPANIRQMATSIQDFLPEAALTSREVSRAFLTMSRGNFLCPLHAKFTKKRTVVEEGAWGYWTTGMHPSGPSVNRTKTQARDRPDGFAHCGCDEDAVLFEFAMWKRWQVRTEPAEDPNSQLESLRGQVMDPRLHLFVKATYEWDTGLAVHDWWAGSGTQAEAARARCHKVIELYQRRLAVLSDDPDNELHTC
ncbi:hypothetical protein JB92DRAFT_3131410 [Gautieria morchelliformis]|nr:hypothetical protein JB92DRAFT_3131410 [Gautieria morchelliformis]